MTKLAKQNTSLAIPGVQLNACGLTFTNQPTESEWTQTGVALQYISGATMFWIGDWANVAQTTWSDKYSELIEATNYDYGTLRDAVWVCSAIELSRRRDKLSFAHHREVARLDKKEQTYWLDTAERLELTRQELRASIKAGKVVRAKDIEATNTKAGFWSVESIILPFKRCYAAAWGETSLESCSDAKRLQTWIDATNPMAQANAKARARLAELGNG